MFEAYRRPWGRLFFLLLAVAGLLHAQAPPTTTVSDVVYRAEDRLALLERNDIRRSVYDRIVNAVITVAISAAIAMHDRWTGR
jgi:succinate dehydrogenase hydrophobic anchor subunit